MKNNAPLILLIEDNPHHMKINREVLAAEGYRILEAETLTKGRELFIKERPNLIVLDIMLPDGSGLKLCQELRAGWSDNSHPASPSVQGSQVPILFLSAKKADEDILAGFEAGGDDYLTKPFTFGVLTNRIKAILRRTGQVPELLTKGLLSIDIYSNKVTFDGSDLEIKGKAFDIIFFLWQNENKFFTADFIYEKIWAQPMLGDDSTFKSTMSRLRKKLNSTGYTITSERSRGYCFERG